MEEAEKDRISLLPDCLLSSIVQLLPPKAAGSTMILSHRWLRIWSSMPLDLNLDSSDSDVSFLSAGSISSILSSHRGPIRRFCVTTLAGVGTRDWLDSLAERRIDDALTLKWATDLEHPTLPRELLGSAGVGLRRLDLHCCRLGLTEDPSSQVPVMPRLDFLYLSNVVISEIGLHRMIKACPVLRELHLFMIHGLRRIVFHSRTLTTLDISTPSVPLDEFCARDMPNLVSLTFSYVDLWRIPTISIDVAKRLHEVWFKLPAIRSPKFNIINVKRMLPFVTSLGLGTKFTSGDVMSNMIHILSLFPCLQRLEIVCFNLDTMTSKHGFGDWESATEGVVCVWKYLRHVLFKWYSGTKGELEFARYLMARAEFLSDMEINYAVDWTLDDIRREKDAIRGKSTSPAQLYFTKNKDCDRIRTNLASFLHRVYLI